MNVINKAKAVARIAHAGQVYGCGSDYFAKHVCEVADRVKIAGGMMKHVAVAYLHDTVEDTVVTVDDLYNMGFSDEIVEAVEAITRRDGEDYLSEYIPRVMKNPVAAFVKAHDLRANTNTGTKESIARRNLKAMEMIK